ncbi:MAG: ABC transporter permease [Planctomycetota bacterium]|jgi:ABC-type transport system involved in multi-copper enzyme maturation permease subunit
MIVAIAAATCREAVRGRSFLGLLVLFIVGVGITRCVGWLAADGGTVVMADLVLSLQALMGVLVAVATGSVLVHSEVRQRTLYTVLSRPLPRWHFVFGKFLGLVGALLAGQLAMLLIGIVYLWLVGFDVGWSLVWAGLLTAEEVCLLAAVSLCWTALSGPLLAAVLSLATWILGHAAHELPGLMHHLDGAQRHAAVLIASLIPDFGMFAYRNRAVYHEPLISEDLQAVPYGLLWMALFLLVTIAVYRRKQL